MSLSWDDDEDLTEIEYKKKSGKKITVPENTAERLLEGEAVELPAPPPQPAKPQRVVIVPATPPPSSESHLQYSNLASTRDRFAAFVIDSLIGFYFYWIAGLVLMKFFGAKSFAIMHAGAGRLATHLIFTSALFFLYYVVMESLLGATLGKLFCRIQVVQENGEKASLGNVVIRNFLRIVDYLFFFLIAVIAMESSPLNQRLGDRAAKTLLVKKPPKNEEIVNLAETPLASTLSRVLAELIDALLAFSFSYSLILLINAQNLALLYVAQVSFPFIFIFYYTWLELLTATTPGKALFRRKVVNDHGAALDGSSAFLRNLFRPLDYILGYPLMVLSRHKQRLGDMAANTLVIVNPNKKITAKSLVGSILALLFTLLFAYLGWTNPNSFVRKNNLNPIEGIRLLLPNPSPHKPVSPTTTVPQNTTGTRNRPTNPEPKASLRPSTLKEEEFIFSTGPNPEQLRPEGIFKQGDLFYSSFKLGGFERNERSEAIVDQDLRIENSQGEIVVNESNLVRYRQVTDSKTLTLLFGNHLKLKDKFVPGKYKATFTLHDRVAATEMSFEKHFEIQ